MTDHRSLITDHPTPMLPQPSTLTSQLTGAAAPAPHSDGDSQLSTLNSQLSTSRRPRLAYILGASHSGSTLLAMLLGAHPEACTVGQLGADTLDDPVRYRCSCGQPIRECGFWKDVRAGMQRKGLDFDVAKPMANIRSTPDPYIR